MSDVKLAEILYTVKRSQSPDPTAIPSWGNAPAEERDAWVVVAARARAEVRERVHAELAEWAAENRMGVTLATDEETDVQRAERFVWERLIRKLGGTP